MHGLHSLVQRETSVTSQFGCCLLDLVLMGSYQPVEECSSIRNRVTGLDVFSEKKRLGRSLALPSLRFSTGCYGRLSLFEEVWGARGSRSSFPFYKQLYPELRGPEDPSRLCPIRRIPGRCWSELPGMITWHLVAKTENGKISCPPD